jgi:hypothetical protein
MSEKVQVGLRVDRDVYEEFKQNVEERKGRWQGVGGEELENAMRHYIKFGSEKPLPDMLAEFNDRLQRVEGAVGAAESDGGVDTYPADEHTRAPAEKPPANAATEKKVRWLAEELLDAEVPNSREIQQVPKSNIVDLVKDRYGFRSDTAERYVHELVARFDLREHPVAGDGLLVSPAEYERIVQQQQEQAETQADTKLDTLEQSEREDT